MDRPTDAEMTKGLGLTSPEAIAAVLEGVDILETEADLAFAKALNAPPREAGIALFKMVMVAAEIPEEVIATMLDTVAALERRAFYCGMAFGATELHDKLRKRADLIDAVAADEGLKERKAADDLAAGSEPA